MTAQQKAKKGITVLFLHSTSIGRAARTDEAVFLPRVRSISDREQESITAGVVDVDGTGMPLAAHGPTTTAAAVPEPRSGPPQLERWRDPGDKVAMDAPRHSHGTTAESLPGSRTDTARVSVVIPTYNEAKNLPLVLSRLPEDVYEVVIVDGCSVDDTVEVALSLRPDARIVLQNRRGKGNAMACGFAAVTGEIVVMLDADGSADPAEIPRFVAALIDGADFAKGTRFARGGGSGDITRTRAWGNRCLNGLTNVLFGTDYTDLCYGYNAFWRHCLGQLQLDVHPEDIGGRLWGDGFEIETIINTRVAKAGLRITEVPSYEHPRAYGESNLNTWRDGARVLRALLVERLNGAARPARCAVGGTC